MKRRKRRPDLQFTDRMRAEQYDNGTWSDRFDVNSIVNTNQVGRRWSSGG